MQCHAAATTGHVQSHMAAPCVHTHVIAWFPLRDPLSGNLSPVVWLGVFGFSHQPTMGLGQGRTGPGINTHGSENRFGGWLGGPWLKSLSSPFPLLFRVHSFVCPLFAHGVSWRPRVRVFADFVVLVCYSGLFKHMVNRVSRRAQPPEG